MCTSAKVQQVQLRVLVGVAYLPSRMTRKAFKRVLHQSVLKLCGRRGGDRRMGYSDDSLSLEAARELGECIA